MKLAAGVGLVASPNPYVGTGASVIPVPVVNLEFKHFFLQGIRGGYRLIGKGSTELNLFSQVQFLGFDPAESDYLEGMESRRRSADGGLREENWVGPK